MKMSEKYPKYYKTVPKGVESLDVYAVCQMFPVNDPTGCINHARKKLLVPGTRTGGKSMIDDIKEARDTLNRYLELVIDTQRIAEHKELDSKMQSAMIAAYKEQMNVFQKPPIFEAAPFKADI